MVYLVLLSVMARHAHGMSESDTPKTNRGFTDFIDRYLEQLDPLEDTGPPLTIWQKTSETFINTRNVWSQMIGNIGQRLDGFFAGREAVQKTNASFVRAGFEQTIGPDDNLELTPFIKFKLDLPTLQENLRLIVESESEEDKSLQDAALETTLARDERNTSLGLKQITEGDTQRWRASSTIGLRFDRDPQPFWKGRYRIGIPLSGAWTLYYRDALYYFHHDGWGHLSRVIAEYDFGEDYLFRSTSEAQWQHDERLMTYAHSLALLREISRKRAIKYEIGVLGRNQPKVSVDDYYGKITYRRKLYKNWLFYEMIPAVFLPRHDQFEVNAELTLRIEAVFSALN